MVAFAWEVLRRLTGKCLLDLARDEAKAFFWPAQVGVAVIAVPAGSEAAVHACYGLWQTALKAGLHQRLQHRLQAAGGSVRPSRTSLAWRDGWAGLTGDPLGPLLFSAVLQSLAAELRALPLDLAFFYLDDDVLADVPGRLLVLCDMSTEPLQV